MSGKEGGNPTREFEKSVKDFSKTVRAANRLHGKIVGGKKRRRRAFVKIALVLLISQILFVILPPFWYPSKGVITSHFSLRSKPESGRIFDLEFHEGLDIAASVGTRVVSSGLGVVSATGWSETAGNYVVVKHLLGFETLYAHLSEINTVRGRISHPFAKIGRVGETGRTTGPHLHFEIKLFSRSLPPRLFLWYHGLRKKLFGF